MRTAHARTVTGHGDGAFASMRREARSLLSLASGLTSRIATMAGVFDIDLDQPEENVSDDELEEVGLILPENVR